MDTFDIAFTSGMLGIFAGMGLGIYLTLLATRQLREELEKQAAQHKLARESLLATESQTLAEYHAWLDSVEQVNKQPTNETKEHPPCDDKTPQAPV